MRASSSATAASTGRLHRRPDTVAGDGQPVASGDRAAFGDAVAHRPRDFAGPDPSRRPPPSPRRCRRATRRGRRPRARRAPRPPRRSAPRPTGRSVRSGDLLRHRDDVLVVRQDDHAVGGARSTASRICAVDGFIDWPPATTCCTPRPSSSRAQPVADRDRDDAGRHRARSACRPPSVADPVLLFELPTCSRRSVTRISRGRPSRSPPRSRRRCRRCGCGSSTGPSPPTTTIESPSAPHVA